MLLKEEFLLIENGKAIIKEIKKEIDTYECLLKIKEVISQLSFDDIIKRLLESKVNKPLIINRIFSKEIDLFECFEPFTTGEYKIHFNLPNDAMKKLKKELKKKINDGVTFSKLSIELQNELAKDFKRSVLNEFQSYYDKFKRNEKKSFIKEQLEEKNIGFCKRCTPSGFHSSSFNYKNLTITHRSNLGYGYRSFSYIYTRIDEVLKIISIGERGEYDEISIDHKSQYSINIAKDILNDFLSDPLEFKKNLLKNNIRKLKELLRLEKENIPIIQNIIIPDLNEKISEIKNNIKQYEEDDSYLELIEKLKIFNEGHQPRSFYKVDSFTSKAITISDRKKRIELLKNEINRLIAAYKDEEDLLEPV